MAWYYSKDNSAQGPVNDGDLDGLIRSGDVSGDTLVWKDGWPDWTPARDTELAPRLPASPPSLPPSGHPGSGRAADGGFDPDPGKVRPSNPPKSPHLAWLNLLLVGVAQMVFGQIGKGLAILGAAIVTALFTAGIGGLAVMVASIVDAYMVGKVLRSGQPVGKWQFFPS